MTYRDTVFFTNRGGEIRAVSLAALESRGVREDFWWNLLVDYDAMLTRAELGEVVV